MKTLATLLLRASSAVLGQTTYTPNLFGGGGTFHGPGRTTTYTPNPFGGGARILGRVEQPLTHRTHLEEGALSMALAAPPLTRRIRLVEAVLLVAKKVVDKLQCIQSDSIIRRRTSAYRRFRSSSHRSSPVFDACPVSPRVTC